MHLEPAGCKAPEGRPAPETATRKRQPTQNRKAEKHNLSELGKQRLEHCHGAGYDQLREQAGWA